MTAHPHRPAAHAVDTPGRRDARTVGLHLVQPGASAPAPRDPSAERMRAGAVWAEGAPVPASGAWREGDPVGDRRFVDIGALDLEGGGHLPHVRMAYETWGTLSPERDNAVLVLHALTGDSHLTGPAGPGHPTAGWWDTMVGPGRPIDTDRWFVVAPNVLGGCQGSTGPASTAPDGHPWGGRFPYVTTRDQVRAEVAVADALGIDTWALVIGASMGGMRVLEWAVTEPARVQRVAALVTTAQTSGDQIAWAHPQLEAIRSDPGWRGGDYYDLPDGEGPHRGLGVARQIAHTTYRSSVELDERFGRLPQGAELPITGRGRYAVQSYLDHHAGKLARRFDANTYLVLTESMLSHDVGRGRGGVEAALAGVAASALVIAVDTDRLYPPTQSRRMAAAIPDAELHVIRSDFGHDGFLIEFEQMGALVTDFLART
ncbi:homoserine O-acetyltransferase [Cellulomonas sp. APG4]|nr:homoserine O-acetyltransferase [Cellulomonas sp. APG4]